MKPSKRPTSEVVEETSSLATPHSLGIEKQRYISHDGAIDLRDLLVFWLKWCWVLVPFALLGAYLGYRDLQGFQPKHVALMVVAPESSNVPGLSTRGGSFLSGLGIDISATNQSRVFERFKVLLGSVDLARRLQEKHGLLQIVYAGSWDESSGEWLRPTGEEFDRAERMRALLKQNPWRPPSVEQLAEYVAGGISIETDDVSGFSTLTFEHPDRDFAIDFLRTVYLEADNLLREQDRAQTQERIAYIEAELQGVTNIESRQTLIAMLASERQKQMLLQSELPYVARVIEGPFVSEDKTEPNVRFMVVIPILGLVGAAFAVLTFVRLFISESKSSG